MKVEQLIAIILTLNKRSSLDICEKYRPRRLAKCTNVYRSTVTIRTENLYANSFDAYVQKESSLLQTTCTYFGIKIFKIRNLQISMKTATRLWPTILTANFTCHQRCFTFCPDPSLLLTWEALERRQHPDSGIHPCCWRWKPTSDTKERHGQRNLWNADSPLWVGMVRSSPRSGASSSNDTPPSLPGLATVRTTCYRHRENERTIDSLISRAHL